MSLAGSLMCARYAFMPNKLKYCGPDENKTLFEYVTNRQPDAGLAEMLAEFKGAWPNLTFIAHANGIADPLDHKVVEAYWLGNSLLNNISAKQYADYTAEQFKKQLSPSAKEPLMKRLDAGGRPHHNFYVYYLFGLRGGKSRLITAGLPTINQCRISWGKVRQVINDQTLLVDSEQIAWNDYLGEPCLIPITREVTCSWEGKSFVPPIQIGTYVSIHWDWVCDVLDTYQLKNLSRYDHKFLGLS